MKADEVTLQNILKAYGKDLKAIKPRQKISKENPIDSKEIPFKKLSSEDINIINYDKDGKVAINPKKKDALIDFFQ